MKNKIICLAVLVLSLIAFAASFNRTQAYYYNNKGNSFFKEMKFQEARDKYNKSLEIKENNEIRNNIIKSLYEEKKYKEITETPSTEYFIRGNSYAFLGDEAAQQNPEEAIKNYKTALEEYKLAMKTSNDLNIKKNYEIVLKKIEALNNNQNQQNQDKQNNKQDQNNEQNSKQNNIPQGEGQPIDSKDEGREGEVRAILKRLEGNEKQSFKNNERVINIDTGNSNNRW